MARITQDDCFETDPGSSRFDLVLVTSKRARQLAVYGKDPHVPWNNDKPTVVALREFAKGYIDKTVLLESDNTTSTV